MVVVPSDVRMTTRLAHNAYDLREAFSITMDRTYIRPASLAIVVDPWKRLLTVTRWVPPFEQALPGGEVDPGETASHAALRELYEETGVFSGEALPIWMGLSPTDGRDVHVFLIGRWSGAPHAREGGFAAWLSPEELVVQAPRFGGFYLDMFRAIG